MEGDRQAVGVGYERTDGNVRHVTIASRRDALAKPVEGRRIALDPHDAANAQLLVGVDLLADMGTDVHDELDGRRGLQVFLGAITRSPMDHPMHFFGETTPCGANENR